MRIPSHAPNIGRCPSSRLTGVLLSAAILLLWAAPVRSETPSREVFPGIATARQIPGEPYDLLGNRIVFTNWYYVHPGDLDWINKEGKSVYVSGNEDPDAAIFAGKEPPRGIRLMARKPNVVGPMELPHRCIMQDGRLYRGWTDNEYCESADGMQWEKKANLVLDKEADGIHQVFVDPSAPPAERYKSIWVTDSMTPEQFKDYMQKRPDGWEPRALLHYGDTQKVNCIRGSVSPDGITWKTLPDPLVVEYADTLNTGYFDLSLRKYVIYTRYWSVGPYTESQPVNIRNSWTGCGRRAIGRSESNDFRQFPPSQLILETPPTMQPSEVLYTNCHTTIPGAPDQHVMFPAVWNASVNDTTRIVLASSHDGLNWHWVPGGDLLETAEHGQWNGGCVWASPNLIELPNGDWALPYSAHNIPHKYPRGQRKGGTGYAVWPKGRMVALEAPDQGQFTLITIINPGASLKVNAVSKRTGGIRVEVAGDPERKFEKCDPLFGDRFWTPVSWQGKTDLGREKGKPVTLRFKLDQAELYGLQFD